MADKKFSEFPLGDDTLETEGVGVQAGENVRFKIANIVDNQTFETVLQSSYFAEQTPNAIDVPKVVLFNDTGQDIVSPDGNVTMTPDGRLLIGDIPMAIVATIKFQVGKTGGASGSVDFISYTTIDLGAGEIVLGEPIHLEFSSDQFNAQKDISRTFQAPPNSTIRFYWYNDSSDGGNNQSALQDYVPTPGVGPGGTDLPSVPSAALSIGTYKSGVR